MLNAATTLVLMVMQVVIYRYHAKRRSELGRKNKHSFVVMFRRLLVSGCYGTLQH